MFKKYYKLRFKDLGENLVPSDGLGDEVVRARLSRLGLAVPRSLFDYYSVAGLHWINQNHNRLRSIDELEWIDDKLVFLEENQCVCYWGVAREGLGEIDPTLWQGVNNETIEWFEETYPARGITLSRFLMELWKWTLTGEDPKLSDDGPSKPDRDRHLSPWKDA